LYDFAAIIVFGFPARGLGVFTSHGVNQAFQNSRLSHGDLF